jgi:glucose/arabinose dehydrogenase/Ca2+-binding RTX toxin-like protein
MSGSVFLRTPAIEVEEANTTVFVEIVRTGPLDAGIQVQFGVAADSATPGLDYLGETGWIEMAEGVGSVRVPITILDDALGEASEVLSVTLIDAIGGTLAAPRTTRITILDDETPAPPANPEPPLVSDYEITFDAMVAGVNQPIRLAFLPGDESRMYVAEKTGRLKMVDLDTGEIDFVLDLRTAVNSMGDRGLLGLAVHPDFETTPYVYLYYTVDPPEAAGLTGNAGIDGAGNRYAHLVRYTADAATGYTTMVPGSEVILLGGAGQSAADISGGGALNFTDPANAAGIASDRMEDADDAIIGGFRQDYIKGDSLSHMGGQLVFGPDGALYVGTGDGTSYNFADPRSPDVQSLDSLSGKILRIDPLTGEGLADNPFVTPGLDLDDNRAKVYQLGLRNPFAFAVDDQGRVVIGDVGWFSFEEVNFAGPGANFGWPYFEGGDAGVLNRTPQYRDQTGAADFYAAVEAGTIVVTAPYRALGHAESAPGFQAQALIGSNVVYTGDVYPEEFKGDFFFSDVSTGRMFSLDMDNPDEIRFLHENPAGPGPIHMMQGADGYIYYADIATGQIGRLEIARREAGPPEPLPPGLSGADLGLVTLGRASVLDAESWQLTPPVQSTVGGIATSGRVDLRADLRVTFEANFGAINAADGIGFALHADPRGAEALGYIGSGFGVVGVQRAVGIEFDTHSNPGEIASDHGMLFTTGTTGGIVNRRPAVPVGELEDGAWHAIEVVWNAESQSLSYSVDGVVRDSLVTSLITTVFGGSPFAHLLIGGATGGMASDFRIRDLTVAASWETPPVNAAPVIAGGTDLVLTLAENETGVLYAPAAQDAEGDAILWDLAEGPDTAPFEIDRTTGTLRFLEAPDFETPGDADGDNIYRITITAEDAFGNIGSQTVDIRVTDVDERIIGTEDDDRGLFGTLDADTIEGRGGQDSIEALDGDDVILATVNDGNDVMDGGHGIDTYDLAATSAAARLSLAHGISRSAETGRDILRAIENAIGGAGADSMLGHSGANMLEGGAGDDTLWGLSGDDLLRSGAGDDSLRGGHGADTLLGGAGHDVFLVEHATDLVAEFAGEGIDRVITMIDYTLTAHVEELVLTGTAAVGGTGNAGDNRLIGNRAANLLQGLDGADTLSGGAGDDTLIGGAGQDNLTGGAGADCFRFAIAADGGDTMFGYRAAEDSIEVSAAGFGGGLVAGMNLLASGRYIANASGLSTAPAGTGQFVYETDARTLHWDADGAGGAGGITLFTFGSVQGWSGSEIVVIA